MNTENDNKPWEKSYKELTILSKEQISSLGVEKDKLWYLLIDHETIGPYYEADLKKFLDENLDFPQSYYAANLKDKKWQPIFKIRSFQHIQEEGIAKPEQSIYLLIAGVKKGPFNKSVLVEKLKSLEILPGTLYCLDLDDDWKRLYNHPDFASLAKLRSLKLPRRPALDFSEIKGPIVQNSIKENSSSENNPYLLRPNEQKQELPSSQLPEQAKGKFQFLKKLSFRRPQMISLGEFPRFKRALWGALCLGGLIYLLPWIAPTMLQLKTKAFASIASLWKKLPTEDTQSNRDLATETKEPPPSRRKRESKTVDYKPSSESITPKPQFNNSNVPTYPKKQKLIPPPDENTEEDFIESDFFEDDSEGLKAEQDIKNNSQRVPAQTPKKKRPSLAQEAPEESLPPIELQENLDF